MNDIKNIEPSQATKLGMGDTHCCASVLIHIRYCSWGGHPKDRWLWEGIVARGGDDLEVGDGWDYGSKEQLIERCKKLGYEYEVHRYKRNGKIEVVQSS
jgi:hypothetical protein